MEDRCLKRKKQASGITIFVTEELGDARLRCNQLKDYINEAVELIEKSDKRDHFFEVAGHLLHGIPDTLMRMEKALGAAAMAVSKWDYEENKEDLRPEKAEQLEDALKDVRTRRVERRSSNQERPMKTHEAAQELQRIAESIDQTGEVDSDAIMTLVASLENDGRRVASSSTDVASVLRGLANGLERGQKPRPSRSVLASALRRVLAETIDVGSSAPPPLPGPGFTPYSLTIGFENIRSSAISAYRRGEHQPKQAFVDLAALVQEVGLMCESLGATNVGDLATRMSKAVLQSRRLLSPGAVEQLMMASDKTAANLAVTQMLKAFAEGSKFGEFEVSDVRGAADRLEAAAMKAAKLAFQYHLDTPPTNLFKEISDRTHDLAFYMGASVAEPKSADLSMPHVRAMASDKTAAAPTVTQMVNAFREGAQFGDYQVRDVAGAAKRVGDAAKAAAKYAMQPNALATKMPLHVFTELAERLYDLGFYIGSASAALPKTASDQKESRFEEGKPADPTENMSEEDAETWKTEHAKNKDNFKEATDDKRSRFEEGKPADPTENMSDEDAAKWKTEHDNNKDNFKSAAFGSSAMRTLQSVAKKVKGDGWNAELDEDETYTVLNLANGIEHDSPKIIAIIHDGDDTATVRMGPRVDEVRASASEIERAIKKFQGTVKQASQDEVESKEADEDKEGWTKAKSLVPKINKNKKYAEDDKRSRFEEGKPADPTENMSDEDAETWKTEHAKNEDNFKEAASYDSWKVAMEHSSPEALRTYLQQHPGADPQKHTVVKDDGGRGSGAVHTKINPPKELATSIKSDWAGSKHDRPGNPVTSVMNSIEKGQAVSLNTMERAKTVLKSLANNPGASKEDASKLRGLRKKFEEHGKVKNASSLDPWKV